MLGSDSGRPTKLAEAFVGSTHEYGSFVEVDTWRKEGIAFINSISRELLA